MLKRENQISHSFRKGVLLLAIYSIHLVCLQALMSAPCSDVNSTFKPLFKSHKKQGSVPHKRAHHPAVTYYGMLFKQGNNVQRTADVLKCAFNIGAHFSEVVKYVEPAMVFVEPVRWKYLPLCAGPARYLLFRSLLI